jgi:hypothetical protein
MLFLRYYLWIVPNLLLALFLFLFLRRRLHVQLPSLLLYVTIQVAGFLTSVGFRLISPFPKHAYQWVCLIFVNGLLALAELWVVYELWDTLVFSRSSLARVGRLLLSCSLAALFLAAVGISATLSGVGDHVANIYEILDFSSNLVLTGLLVVLALFSRALRLSWRNWIVGITLGFGIIASVQLSSAAWRAALGEKAFIPVDIAQGFAFHFCAVVWLVYLLLPERPRFSGPGPRAEDIDHWNEQLQQIAPQ